MSDLERLLDGLSNLRNLALNVARGPLSDLQIKQAIKSRFGLAAAMRPETVRRIRHAVMAVF